MQKFKRLRMKMFEEDLAQGDLAELLQVDSATLGRRLRGECDFHLSEIHEIVRILKIPHEQVLDYFPLNGEARKQ